jgi:hypothetical protein
MAVEDGFHHALARSWGVCWTEAQDYEVELPHRCHDSHFGNIAVVDEALAEIVFGLLHRERPKPKSPRSRSHSHIFYLRAANSGRRSQSRSGGD